MQAFITAGKMQSQRMLLSVQAPLANTISRVRGAQANYVQKEANT